MNKYIEDFVKNFSNLLRIGFPIDLSCQWFFQSTSIVIVFATLIHLIQLLCPGFLCLCRNTTINLNRYNLKYTMKIEIISTNPTIQQILIQYIFSFHMWNVMLHIYCLRKSVCLLSVYHKRGLEKPRYIIMAVIFDNLCYTMHCQLLWYSCPCTKKVASAKLAIVTRPIKGLFHLVSGNIKFITVGQ